MHTQRSESIAGLAVALVALQGKLEAVRKTKTAGGGGKYSYSYADLAEIMATVQPLLTEAGIAVVQSPANGDGGVELETLLIHGKSGEYLASSYRLPVAGTNDPQALGKAITYARRYALTAMLGIVTEDDDGQSARTPEFDPHARRSSSSSSRRPPADSAPKPAASGEGIGTERAAALQGELGRCGVGNALAHARKVLKRNVESLSELTDKEAVRIWQAASQEQSREASGNVPN